MRTIHETLAAAVRAGRKLLVPYVCAGFPSPADTLPVLEALAEAGADAIELGVPFSDPLLDGPVIQGASSRALAQGTTLASVLETAQAFTARRETPLILMSCCNPLLRLGAARFAEGASAARIRACIVPDLPLEAQGLLPGAPPFVPIAAPNTRPERLRVLLESRPPFLYAMSVLGITGVRDGVSEDTQAFLRRAKSSTSVPVLAGFGVSHPTQALEFVQSVDGVIVGSALLKVLDGSPDAARAAFRFLQPFREALDAVAPDAVGIRSLPCC